jgi:holin-like protein
LTIILLISFIGEILHLFVPLPVPAGIYGLLIMLTGLNRKLITPNDVGVVGIFLIEIMPVMFIPAAVGLLDSWKTLIPILVPFLVITLSSTILVMIVTGKSAQIIMEAGREKDGKNE